MTSLVDRLLSRRSSYFFPLASGVLLSLALPYFKLWFLAWIALVPFLLFLRAPGPGMTRKRLVWGTFVMGLPFATAAAYPLLRISDTWWVVPYGSSADFHELLYMSGVVLAFWWGALFFLPFAWCAARRSGKFGTDILLLSAVWAFAEFVRARFGLFGYDWGTLGYALLDTRYIKYAAHFFGVYSLSFLIVGWNVFLVLCLEAAQKESMSLHPEKVLRRVFGDMRAVTGVIIFLVIFHIALLYGITEDRDRSFTLTTPLTVAVIASAIRTEESLGENAYLTYRGLLEEALLLDPHIVLLPENALPYFEIDEKTEDLYEYALVRNSTSKEKYAEFLALSRKFPEAIIGVGLHTISDRLRYNSVVLYQNGRITTIYHKRKLVPFFEYAPYGLPVPIMEHLEAGGGNGAFSLLGHTATALICSEDADPSLSTRNVQIILSPSNDSVFESPTLARMHVAMTRMRALESGAYLFRASKGGISGIIGPDGEFVARQSGNGVVFAVVQ